MQVDARVSYYGESMKKKKAEGEKNAVAQAMVAMRNKKLSPARRKAIATKAAKKRWEDRGEASTTTANKKKAD
jgi:hypothetical protein